MDAYLCILDGSLTPRWLPPKSIFKGILEFDDSNQTVERRAKQFYVPDRFAVRRHSLGRIGQF